MCSVDVPKKVLEPYLASLSFFTSEIRECLVDTFPLTGNRDIPVATTVITSMEKLYEESVLCIFITVIAGN